MLRAIRRIFVISSCLFSLGCTTGGKIEIITESQVNPRLALDLLDASIQTYREYAGKPVVAPEGWIYKGETFKGDDFFLGTTSRTVFGAVFEKADDPASLLFAFRGTDNLEEWWDDLQVSPRAFVPTDESVKLPGDLRVEAGFDKVYQSMKAGLFKKLDQHKASKVYVTGHSLGSALSELFVFDLMLSRPGVTVISYNFACPRVGNQQFVNTYTGQSGQKVNPTVRFVNTEDIVPKVPLKFEGYVHLPLEFDISFKEASGILPNYGLRHSADNYFRVLQAAFDLPDAAVTYFSDTPDHFVILNQKTN